MEQGTPSPSDLMLQIVSGFWISKAVQVAAELGLADHLSDQPRTAAELAEATGTHAPSLHRVLRALSSVGVFAEDDRGRFLTTPVGATLRSNAPGSLRAFVISELGGEHYTAFGGLRHSVETGGIAFDHVFGMSCWDYFAGHPESARVFNDSMTELTRMIERAVVDGYDFSEFARVVDIGGGHGGLIAAILRSSPSARGVLFDAPHVVEGAGNLLEDEGVAGRCEVVGGDFFDAVPAGGDLYLLKAIIHDWNDSQATAILKNCQRAMARGGKLLLVELVIPQDDSPHLGKFLDLVMMVMTGGRERTEDDFRGLLAASGLRLTRVIPTRSPVCLIESVREDD